MAEESLESFLEKLGFGDAIDKFKEEDIDFDLLKTMTVEDLKDTGLSIGKRKKILQAITAKENVRARDRDYEESTDIEGQPNYQPPVASISEVSDNEEAIKVGNSEFVDGEIRIVLLGKTGTGKSATANTILGEKMFKAIASGSSVTKKCLQKSAIRFGRKVVIVDTPGVFDTEESNKTIQEEIGKCLGITSPGPHAFILVLSVTRYTEEDNNSVMHFVKHFGEAMLRYCIVLFTRKDDLDDENQTLMDHLESVPQHLKNFIQKIGGRVIAFNNKLMGEDMDPQVKQLMSIVLKNVEENDCKHYTNEMYEEAERCIQEMEKERLRKAKDQRDKEIKDILKKYAETCQNELSKREEQLQKLENQIKSLMEKKGSYEAQLKPLLQETNNLQKKINDGKCEEKGLKENLQSLNVKMSSLNTAKDNNANEIEKLTQEYEKEKSALEKKLKDEKMKREAMEREVNARFRKLEENIREISRRMIEQGKGFWEKVMKERIWPIFQKLNPFNWFKSNKKDETNLLEEEED